MRSSTTDNLLKSVTDALRPLHPFRIVLFGSYATGLQNPDSDLDLLVVLDTQETPRSFSRRMELQTMVAQHLRHLRCHVPIDLVVHTQSAYERLMTRDSMFARQLREEGKVLYEGRHERVA